MFDFTEMLIISSIVFFLLIFLFLARKDQEHKRRNMAFANQYKKDVQEYAELMAPFRTAKEYNKQTKKNQVSFSKTRTKTLKTGRVVISGFAGAGAYIWDGKYLQTFAGKRIAAFDGIYLSDSSGAIRFTWENNLFSNFAGSHLFKVSNNTILKFAGEKMYQFDDKGISKFSGPKIYTLKGDIPVPEPIWIVIVEALL